MIKVAIDTSLLQTGHNSRGMGYYVKNLVQHLKEHKQLQVEEFTSSKNLNKDSIDLIHYPYFDLFARSLPFSKTKPVIVTIADVTPLLFSKHYPSGIRGKVNNFIQKLSLNNVKAVITFSENSKKDITKYLKVEKGKIYPIYLAAAEHFRKIKDEAVLKQVKSKYNLPEKFALFVGNVNWNKNIIGITQACLEANINLVLVGKSFEDRSNLDHPELESYKEFLKRFSENPLVHVLGFVPDDDLAALYNVSKMALLPSFYEGFGLPILEAQACGTPVITGKVSSMPEVAGEGAILVDPYNVKEIQGAISTLLTDSDLKEGLVKKGFENVKSFSWGKAAGETVKVYRRALGDY